MKAISLTFVAVTGLAVFAAKSEIKQNRQWGVAPDGSVWTGNAKRFIYAPSLRFPKVHLKPGETRRVMFRLGSEDLMILDRNMNWTVEPGEFEIMVGASSEKIMLRDKIRVSSK